MPPPDAPSPPSLWTRDFVLFLVSLSAATLAIQMQAAVVAFELYAVTRDPLSLGLIGLAEAVPFIGLALLGGHVADRHDRRRIVLTAFSLLSVAALALLAASTHQARLTAPVFKSVIYGVIFLGGVCRAFLQPARTALSAQIVPRVLYPRAVAWRAGLFQLCAVVGPGLGGVLFAWLGGSGAYLVSASLLAVAGLAMVGVRVPARKEAPPAMPVWSSVREGVRFLVRDKVLFPALILDLFAVLFGGAVALLPIFAEEILQVGPRGFGALRAAPAVGALLASALLALRGPMRRAGPTLLVSVAGFGVAMIGFGLSRVFLLSVLLLVASGALDMISILVRSTLLQLRVPEHMLGRVSSVNQIFVGSSNEIGALESGIAARLLGTVPSVVLGGTATLLVVGAVSWRAPELRRLGPLTAE